MSEHVLLPPPMNLRVPTVKNTIMPKGVSVKVKYLRPAYDNLEEWLADDKHVLVTRRGRVFITNKETKDKKVFHYPESPWSNPYTVKEYPGGESLRLYDKHLDNLLKDDRIVKHFMKLKDATEIGCFCDSGARCHRDIILTKLKQWC